VALPRTQKRDELRMWRSVLLLTSRVNEAAEKVLQSERQLTISEFTVLLTLSEADQGSVRMSPLAAEAGLDQSSLTRLIARLEQRGLAERCVCAEDKRGVFSRITDEGRAAVAVAKELFRHEVSAALAEASLDEVTAPIVARLRYRMGD
jgi:DNA-binding MarR family transcriptional regulator